jgi:ribosome recycling factor
MMALCCVAHFTQPGCFSAVGVDVSHISKRFYAKGRDKGKNKGGKGGHGQMKLSKEELDSVINSDTLKRSFETQLDHLREGFTQQLTLRTTIGAFNDLTIETTDGKFPLIQLSHVAQKGQQAIIIDLSMSPQYIPAVKTTLINSMGLNPQQDGTTLFVNIPKVTKEHRETLAKTAKSLCNTTKTKLRDVQNKFMNDVKKKKDHHSEDLIFSVQAAIQDQAKEYGDKADQLLAAKTKELLGGK